MPLLLADLDDTLIDRRGSFRCWAAAFCAAHGLGDEVEWLAQVDAFGYTPRLEFHTAVRERFGLPHTVEQLAADYDRDYPGFTLAPSAESFALLRRLRASGWRIGVVTNGRLLQTRKLEQAGLASLVDACCVSEVEGIRKPERGIFERAAALCGQPLAGAWMAGDNPDADIRGAHALGLSTIWFRHGRTWSEPDFSPTLIVDSLEEALGRLAGLP
jgi:FMN phosphatase YigB (HAD superfamily)